MSQTRKTVLFLQTGSSVLARRKLAGVTDFARRVNWRVIVPNRPSAGYDVRQLLHSYRPDGIIAECSGPHCELTRRALNGTPVVYLCRDPAEVTSYADVVTNDSPACGRIAARAFAEAGVRTAAFVGTHHSVYWSDRKRDGFIAAAKELGIAAVEFPSKATAANDPLDRRRRRLMAWLRGLPRPVGVFTVSDEFGMNLVDACRDAGLKVPDDVSVIAVNDDETLCESCDPTLSSIRLDYEQTGRIAAERLFGRLSVMRTAGTATSVPPVGLTRRGSLAVPKRADPESIRAIEYIRLHATEGISAVDVISRYGCSRRTAEQRFVSATGHTTAEVIVRTRIERAKELLRRGDIQTGAVANLAGWRSETLFRRQFKKATGMTPLKFRDTTCCFSS